MAQALGAEGEAPGFDLTLERLAGMPKEADGDGKSDG
jgi:hypothetical protein